MFKKNKTSKPLLLEGVNQYISSNFIKRSIIFEDKIPFLLLENKKIDLSTYCKENELSFFSSRLHSWDFSDFLKNYKKLNHLVLSFFPEDKTTLYSFPSIQINDTSHIEKIDEYIVLKDDRLVIISKIDHSNLILKELLFDQDSFIEKDSFGNNDSTKHLLYSNSKGDDFVFNIHSDHSEFLSFYLNIKSNIFKFKKTIDSF